MAGDPQRVYAHLQHNIEAEAEFMRVIRNIFSSLCASLVIVALIPAVALAIPRDEALSRGRVWVQRNVPYSQSRYATVDGTVLAGTSSNGIGYRTDCSGFVSMCWDLRRADGTPLNLDTAGLDTTSLVEPVVKESLQPGDMLLLAKDTPAGKANGGGHAVIFVAWADALQTKYYSYEEAGSRQGAVSKLRVYEESIDDGFLPYRYRKIDPDFADVQERISGLDRFDTAVAAVEKSFPPSTTVSVASVVIASGETWADALGGSALAGAYEGPLLLTSKKTLPAATRAALVRLNPRKIIVLGGVGTVSAAVESQLRSFVSVAATTAPSQPPSGTQSLPATQPVIPLPSTPVEFERIGGANRYDVSQAVARAAVAKARQKGTVDTVYLATGLNFPDALAASPLSARARRPILLTRKDELPQGTLTTIRELGIKTVIILGGTGSVSEKVVAQLKGANLAVGRLGGANRYDTAIKIAHHGVDALGMTWSSAGLASGDAYADALSGGVAQGQTGAGAVVLLTPSDALDMGVSRELGDHRAQIGRLRVFGGSGTVKQATRKTAASILRAMP